MEFTAAGTLTVASGSSVTGGAGGSVASSADYPHAPKTPGAGGAGVVGVQMSIVNTGTISGGLNGAGYNVSSVRSDAIDFAGGPSSLTLSSGGVTGTIAGGLGVGGALTIDPGVDADQSVTLSGGIHDYQGGHGVVQKIGAGTLILTGAMSYTGGTTVSAGTLQIGTDTVSAYLAGNAAVATGAHLVFDVATEGTVFSGTISGAGDVTKSGSGTLSLDGAFTQTGGATISSGTLQLGYSGVAGSIQSAVVLQAGTHLDVVVDGSSVTGPVSGAGNVLIDTDVTSFAHANTYTGGTTIDTGVFDVATVGAAGTGAITFATGVETLQIETQALGSDGAHTFANTITGLGVDDGDAIDLRGVHSTDTVSYSAATGDLTVLNGGTVEATLDIGAGYGSDFFFVAPDTSAGGDGNDTLDAAGIRITLKSQPYPLPISLGGAGYYATGGAGTPATTSSGTAQISSGVVGGAGSVGTAGDGYSGGGGGAGGAGVLQTGGALTITGGATVSGGVGGAGGASAYAYGASGGGGGNGVYSSGGSITVSNGSIVGGAGGHGGASKTYYPGPYSPGGGGAGGAGVLFVKGGGSLTVAAGSSVTGGAGAANTSASGGVGVAGFDMSIVNGGTISGGLGGDGVSHGDAIDAAGGTNTLTLSTGGHTGTIVGDIAVAGILQIDRAFWRVSR